MPKKNVTHSVSEDILKDFKTLTEKGERSDIIEDFMRSYIQTFGSEEEEDELIEKKEEELEELKQELEELTKKIKQEQVLLRRLKDSGDGLTSEEAEFIESEISKFRDFRGDFDDFEAEYPGIYEKFVNTVNTNLSRAEFWNYFESLAEGDT